MGSCGRCGASRFSFLDRDGWVMGVERSAWCKTSDHASYHGESLPNCKIRCEIAGRWSYQVDRNYQAFVTLAELRRVAAIRVHIAQGTVAPALVIGD